MNQKINYEVLLSNGFRKTQSESPSNIALIKYWGKVDGQIPMNPSISYTLDKCKTTFEVFFKKSDTPSSTKFYFEGLLAPSFAAKSLNLLEIIQKDFPELSNYELILNSKNSFPHSSGIASSASSMSALSICLLDIINKSNDLNLVSYYARLGSGSACRSIFSPMASWGKNKLGNDFTDEFATEISGAISNKLKSIGDTIVLVHEGEKEVSSSKGHALMNNHPYRETRIENAKANFYKLINALREGDIKSWGEIIESEALELHAMMMTSSPGFILVKPKTLEVIEKVRLIRRKYGVSTYFTLDAGPNVHILYPLHERDEVLPLLNKYLVNLKMIHDQVGQGTRILKGSKC
jgi:diphosphomevalonate decarboxylase